MSMSPPKNHREDYAKAASFVLCKQKQHVPQKSFWIGLHSTKFNLCINLVCTLMQCVVNMHTHTLCTVVCMDCTSTYVHVFVLDVSLRLHMPPVVYLVGSTVHVAKF